MMPTVRFSSAKISPATRLTSSRVTASICSTSLNRLRQSPVKVWYQASWLAMPPLPRNKECRILAEAGERIGLHPFDIPMLRNSVPYGGRPACMRCRWCVGFACEVDAKCGTQNTVIPTALATGHCALDTDCMVERIQLDARGRATGITYFGGGTEIQRACGFEDSVEEIIELIRQMDFPLSSCKCVIATHADVDHVQGLAQAKQLLRTTVTAHPTR